MLLDARIDVPEIALGMIVIVLVHIQAVALPLQNQSQMDRVTSVIFIKFFTLGS